MITCLSHHFNRGTGTRPVSPLTQTNVTEHDAVWGVRATVDKEAALRAGAQATMQETWILSTYMEQPYWTWPRDQRERKNDQNGSNETAEGFFMGALGQGGRWSHLLWGWEAK